jgi:rhodanese-related sulfurtransferase
MNKVTGRIRINKLPVIMTVLFNLFGCSGSEKLSSDVSFSSVSAQEFHSLLERNNPDSVLLDIRTPQEYSEGHIKYAVNIDFYSRDFMTRLSGLDKAKTYLIYCRSGNRTSRALSIMRKLGFAKVVSLKNGISGWAENNLPLK